ncbi:Hypothetical predicted protein [Olea europaea subsp. europaea]|uniref:Uncharacterized protein n=1 Tax=Olea europaea subsp. europaea TaxID=158383 RepID=A0A8S0QB31_OLEEU|nr:Hypothetical predicted protein [Olea europaea subsp. europaea]
MAKGTRGRRGIASRQCRSTPYPLPATNQTEVTEQKKCSKIFDKKDWEDATCSVCMECPHNAVLLLCSSHDKGCRPYMCGTSIRYSNCLDQYKKAYTKVTPSDTRPVGYDSLDSQVMSPLSCEVMELACPLCRGQVKGWTVVEPAREHLNVKKRSCMQDNCSFVGTYKELRKHVRVEHASAKLREVDPVLEQKWRKLEHERETQDVVSTIRSSVPGAVFFGDYVIEGSHYGFNSSEEEHYDADGIEQDEGSEVGIDRNLMRFFLFFQAFGSAGSRSHERDSDHSLDRGASYYFDQDDDDFSLDDGNSNTSLTGRLRRRGRVLSGRNRREGNGN